MNPVLFTILTAVTALAMEPVSAAIHRYIGHGVAWPLHRGHHLTPVKGPELNDVIPLVSAVVTIGAFALGTFRPGFAPLVPIALGATIYGAVYFVMHDIYIHRRVPLLPRRIGVLEPFKTGHLLHHQTGTGHWGIFSRADPPIDARGSRGALGRPLTGDKPPSASPRSG